MTIDSDSWCTPKELADELGYFDLDPCSNHRSHIQAGETCALDHALEANRDGLAFDWTHRSVFMNHPYSNSMPWARKLAAHAAPWCALVKLDPSTRWWAELMSALPVVAPFRHRVRFERPDKPPLTANFPSALVFRRWWPSKALAGRLWMPVLAMQEAA